MYASQQQPPYSSSGGGVHNTNIRKHHLYIRTSLPVYSKCVSVIARLCAYLFRGHQLSWSRAVCAKRINKPASRFSDSYARARCAFRGRILNTKKKLKYEQTNKLTTQKRWVSAKKTVRGALPGKRVTVFGIWIKKNRI